MKEKIGNHAGPSVKDTNTIAGDEKNNMYDAIFVDEPDEEECIEIEYGVVEGNMLQNQKLRS